MSTIVTINSTDLISNSRADINTNFSNLNTDKFETSNIDTDTSLAANSDTKVASQKAVKTYIDTQGGANASETVRGIVEEATDAEVTAGTATGGTGAKLFITPAKLATRLTTLAYQQAITSSSGVTTRASDAASSTVNVAHGLSRTPKFVRLTAFTAGASNFLAKTSGFFNGSAGSYVYEYNYTAAATDSVVATGSSNAFLCSNDPAVAAYQSAVITMDATNVIFTWTKTGSPAAGDTYHILWEAVA